LTDWCSMAHQHKKVNLCQCVGGTPAQAANASQ